MKQMTISLAATVALAVAVLLSTAGRNAGAQTTGQQCFCGTDVFVVDNGCSTCTDLTLSNVVERTGKCNGAGGNCNGASTRTCRVTGTATEVGCSGIVDQPFTLESACGQTVNGDSEEFPCTGDPGFSRFVLLSCHTCAVP